MGRQHLKSLCFSLRDRIQYTGFKHYFRRYMKQDYCAAESFIKAIMATDDSVYADALIYRPALLRKWASQHRRINRLREYVEEFRTKQKR